MHATASRAVALLASVAFGLLVADASAQEPSATVATLSAVASDGHGGAIAVGHLRDRACVHPLAEAGGDATPWRAQRVAVPGGCGALEAVVADGRGGAWAVGEAIGADDVRRTLVVRYDGRGWSVVPSPTPGRQSSLNGVAISTNGDVVAVGSYDERANGATSGATRTLAMTYSGSAWRVLPTPTPGTAAVLNGVTAAFNGRLWAVGYVSDRPPAARRTLALVYDPVPGWQIVATPSPPTNAPSGTTLNAVAAGGGAVWAVGRYVDGTNHVRALTLRGDARGFAVVPAPAIAASDLALEDIAVAADGTAWTAGWYTDGACRHALTMRALGVAWEPIATPAPTVCTTTRGTALYGLVIGAQGMLYAVGEANLATFAIVNRGSGWQIIRP